MDGQVPCKWNRFYLDKLCNSCFYVNKTAVSSSLMSPSEMSLLKMLFKLGFMSHKTLACQKNICTISIFISATTFFANGLEERLPVDLEVNLTHKAAFISIPLTD